MTHRGTPLIQQNGVTAFFLTSPHATCLPREEAAAAAKSLQSCPTQCDPRDGSLPGSLVPGILQARTVEWVAISFSNAWKWKVKVKLFSCVWLVETPWTAAYQAPPSMGLSRQEYWSGVPLPSLREEAVNCKKLSVNCKKLLDLHAQVRCTMGYLWDNGVLEKLYINWIWIQWVLFRMNSKTLVMPKSLLEHKPSCEMKSTLCFIKAKFSHPDKVRR